jgi:heat shock protein HslJ
MKQISYLFVFLVLAGCSKNISNEEQSLLRKEWKLKSIEDTKTYEISEYPDSITNKEIIEFTDSLSVLTYNATCNAGFGRYSLQGSQINIDSLAGTKMFCKYIKWEYILVNNLDSAVSYQIENNQLVIFSKGSYNLNFACQP